ncbi:hypothetical protein [Pseudonocardia sp. GCM10023141]|uniref:hypothetical protein n=1 Tax=Pseudonocardia sp. GCM10023141 TaxID=3252653 RepID=UPI003623BE2F
MQEMVGTRPLDLDAMAGTWYVVRTSLPFWRTRTDPRITYRRLANGTVDDLVEYTNGRGRAGRVHGVDTPDAAVPRIFHWRGTGPTRLLTSDWALVANDERYAGWAVTYFGRTLFTPAGMDVYARQPHPGAEVVAAALAALPDHPALAEQAGRLFVPHHT